MSVNSVSFDRMYNDDFLQKKLDERREQNALRKLMVKSGKIDFCSNDYLGIVAGNLLMEPTLTLLSHGSSGSRLLSGNYPLVEEVEKELANFHNSESALVYNSGYDANLGLLACIAHRGDTILYDQLSHASIRDGIRLSFANSTSYNHNDLNHLELKLQHASGNTFVVTESVFSMDGDICPLQQVIHLTKKYKAHLIIDEAHATGVLGKRGEGLVQQLNLQNDCFARVHTFGKAVGCHGAVVLGSHQLRSYLINFSRSFMYSTALPPVALAAIQKSYSLFPFMNKERDHLQHLIQLFQQSSLSYPKLISLTPIQGIVVPGNENVKRIASHLQNSNFDVRPILYPTVPKEKERLRIVLHSFNTTFEVEQLISLLS